MSPIKQPYEDLDANSMSKFPNQEPATSRTLSRLQIFSHSKAQIDRQQSNLLKNLLNPVAKQTIDPYTLDTPSNLNNEAYKSNGFQNSILKFKEPYSKQVNHNSNDAAAKKSLKKLQHQNFNS